MLVLDTTYRCPMCNSSLRYFEDGRNAYLRCDVCGEGVRVPIYVLARRFLRFAQRRVDASGIFRYMYSLFLDRLTYVQNRD